MKLLTFLRIGYAALAVGVLAIALLPAPYAVAIFAWDKLNHALAFIVLAGLAKLLWPRVSFLVPFTLLALFGGAIEVLQWEMGFDRDADWRDFAADVVAIMIGIVGARILLALRPPTRPDTPEPPGFR